MSALTLSDLHVTWPGGARAVTGVSLDVPAGGRVAVVGASGCGKSSLLQAIVGRAPIARGQVVRLGRRVRRPSGGRRDAACQLLSQDPLVHLDPWRTLAHQLTRTAALHRHADPRSAAAAALHQVGLADRARARPGSLSGGEARRAALARVGLTRPQLLLADEPTQGVDAAQKDGLLELLWGLSPAGAAALTVVLVTHDLPLAARWCDTAVILEAGTVAEVLPASRLPRATSAAGRALVQATPAWGGGA